MMIIIRPGLPSDTKLFSDTNNNNSNKNKFVETK